MKNNFYTSVAVSTVLLTGISLLVEASFGRALTENYIGWILLSSLLIVISLGLIARNSVYVGWKLSLFIFSIYFVIGHFNLLIEAYLFDVTNAMDTALVASQGLIISFVFSPLLVRILGKWEGELVTLDFPSRTKLSWTWRIVLGDFLYVFLYLLAGMILYWDAVLSLPLIPLFAWLITDRFIGPEEERLRRNFGASFERYAQQVKRWL